MPASSADAGLAAKIGRSRERRAFLRRIDRRALLALTIVHLALHAILIATTVAPARDSLRFLAYTRALEAGELEEVALEREDHPLYPLFLTGLFAAGRSVGLDGSGARLALAQGASSLFGLLTILLLYGIVARNSGRAIATAVAFTMLVLPRPAWLTTELLSDPLYALCWAAAAIVLIGGLAGGRPRSFLAAGLLGSLAFGVRVDALGLLATGVLACAVVALSCRRRRASLAMGGALFAAGFAVLPLAFLGFYGALSPKPSFRNLLSASGDTRPPLATIWIDGDTGLAEALAGAAELFAQHLQYVVLLPLAALAARWLSALFSRGRRIRPGPSLATHRGSVRHSARSFALTAVLFQLVLVAWASRHTGYATGRYFLAVAPFAVFLSGDALLAWRHQGRSARRRRLSIGAFFTVVVLASLPSLLGRRLHQDVEGAMAAARWIADHASANATLFDADGRPSWRHALLERRVPELLPADPRPHYIIAEPGLLAREPKLAARLAEGGAEVVARFPRSPRRPEEVVLVLSLPPSAALDR